MTEKRRGAAENGQNGHFTDAVQRMFNPDMANALREAFEASIKAAMNVQDELMTFANHRMQSNAAAREAMLGSKSWEDAVKLQQDWARTWAEDYMQESAKLMELSRGVLQQSFAPFMGRNGKP